MRRPRAEARFDLEQEADRRAWVFLQSSSRSRSRLIIAALNAYADIQDEQARQDAFCDRVIEAIRTELRGNVMAAGPLPAQPEVQATNTDEDAMDAFLDSFQ
jgi:hypothetical protein